jgi:hypothetical protein
MNQELVRFAALLLPLGLLAGGSGTRAGEAVANPGLEEALRTAGWQVQRLGDGGLEMRLARPPSAPPPAAEPAATPEPQAEASAWNRLRARGWRVERAEDGSILLFPPAASTSPPAAPATAPSPPPETGARQAEQPSVAKAPAGASGMEALLRARGWRAERQTDGSLLAYPMGRGARQH